MNETTVPLTKVPSAFYVSLIWIPCLWLSLRRWAAARREISSRPSVPPQRRHACGSLCVRAGWPVDPYEEDRAHSRVSQNPTRRSTRLNSSHLVISYAV